MMRSIPLDSLQWLHFLQKEMLLLFLLVLSCGRSVAQDPCPPFEPGEFRTQTQGGWGAEECSGGNPACYLAATFAAAFPEGLTIGCEEGNHWTFTSAETVSAFLPQGSTAALLGFDAVDPVGEAGVLAGQLVAAKLSLAFDAVDEGFGASSDGIVQLTFADGIYEGWTVGAVISTADLVIGGCIPFDGSLSDLVEALTLFNEAFVDGTVVSGGLSWPGCEDEDNGGGGSGGGGSGGGGSGGGDGPDFGGCDGVACLFEVNCPSDVQLGCIAEADTAAAVNGFPEVVLVCCTTNIEEGLIGCDTLTPVLDWQWSDVVFGSCPTTVVRTFSAPLVEAGFDTTVTCSQTLLLNDTTAPTILCPPDLALGCGEDLEPAATGFATATDACGTVIVTYVDAPLTSEEGIARIWTATDACGNTASCQQSIALPDATPPMLTLTCPSDTALTFVGDCTLELPDGSYGEATATATDALDANPLVTVVFEDVTAFPCSGQAVVTRVWTATAQDACGNEVTASCEQTITYTDDSAPEFNNTCGIGNGDTIQVCCSPDGSIDLPPACLVTLSDNCGATVIYDEVPTSGYAPAPGAQQACSAVQPEPFENGLTCEGDTAHVLRLFCFPGTDEQVAYFTAMGVGEVQIFDETTWTLSWSVMAFDNPNAGFDLTATFNEGVDWNGWNSRGVPAGFKGECVDMSLALGWMYYILDEGTLTGWGDYTGSEFTLSHQPESKFYGAQVGEGANQHNARYGFGSTLNYSGTLVVDGNTVASDIKCCGDLHGEIECCEPFTITRTYTASDCAGNTTVFSYVIQSLGDDCPEADGGTADRTVELPQNRSGAIGVTGMAPNPAGDDVTLRFAVDEPLTVEATLLDMAGQVVLDLGARDADPGIEETLRFDVGRLPAGLYQLRLTAPGEAATRNLLVVH